MKSLTFLILLASATLKLPAQVISLGLDMDQPTFSFKTGTEVMRFLHETYRNGPCKAYTFSQKNTHYRNDSIIGKSGWQEAIEFPDKFRIDFGDKASGNFVIFKNDSSYRYKNGELKTRKADANTLLLLLGGMYYRSLEDVLARLEKAGYNTAVLSKQRLNRQKVYVVGAAKGDVSSNQIWISKNTWRIVRIIEKTGENGSMDVSFDRHQAHCKGYVESKVTFKRNGKIEQVEEYEAITPVENFPDDVFNPAQVKK